MPSDETRSKIIQHLEHLNKIIPAHRKAQAEINSAKAEVATLQAKLAAGTKTNDADFARLVQGALDPW